jgi:hypothetical protein
MPSVALVYYTESDIFSIVGSKFDEYPSKPRIARPCKVIKTLNNIDNGSRQWIMKKWGFECRAEPYFNPIDSEETGLEYFKKLTEVMEYYKKTGFYTPEAEERSLAWKEFNNSVHWKRWRM